jgi:vancomycin resistance protein VanJ
VHTRSRLLPAPGDYVGWGALLICAAVSCWYLLFQMIGDGQRLGYLNAFGFWWGLLALLASAALAWRRALIFGLAGLCLAGMVLSHGVAIPALDNAVIGAEGLHFRVVTASLRNFNDDMDAAAALLAREKPDILVVQEADASRFAGALQRVSGHRWNLAQQNNELILCRCSVSDVRRDGNILSAQLALGKTSLRVWNVRAPKSYSYVVKNRIYFNELASQVRASRSGIAAGDFNATPWNEGYRNVARVARDSWLRAGWGPGFTFPTRARRMGLIAPLMRIDHVFGTADLVAIEAETSSASAGADHLPVIVDFGVLK